MYRLLITLDLSWLSLVSSLRNWLLGVALFLLCFQSISIFKGLSSWLLTMILSYRLSAKNFLPQLRHWINSQTWLSMQVPSDSFCSWVFQRVGVVPANCSGTVHFGRGHNRRFSWLTYWNNWSPWIYWPNFQEFHWGTCLSRFLPPRHSRRQGQIYKIPKASWIRPKPLLCGAYCIGLERLWVCADLAFHKWKKLSKWSEDPSH